MTSAIDRVQSYYSPATSLPLTFKDDRLISESSETFPVIDQIPRFVSSSNYAAAFGLQWNKYRKTQLDSYTRVPLSENRLRRCLGQDLWDNLQHSTVLEAGCGAGRFTEILLREGASVCSVDLSSAVTANQENFPQSASHQIAQADILNLPFRKASFDLVLCLGVLQHTPSPEQTIQKLAQQVKPGGYLVVDHYRFNIWNFLKTAYPLRIYLKTLPPDEALRIVERIVDFFLPWHSNVRGSRIAEFLVSRISPVLAYYRMLPELTEQLQYEWALLDTYDSLTDFYKHVRFKSQIRRALKNANLEVLHCEYGGNGIEARAMAP